MSSDADCYRCITAAIASQLVLSVESTPGEEQLLALGEIWDRLTEFGKGITNLSLTEISAQLDAFKGEITAILLTAPPVVVTPSPTPSSTASPNGSPADESVESPAPTAPPTTSSAPPPSGSASPPQPPTEEPTTQAPTTQAPTETPTATASPEPAPTSSPSPSSP